MGNEVTISKDKHHKVYSMLKKNNIETTETIYQSGFEAAQEYSFYDPYKSYKSEDLLEAL